MRLLLRQARLGWRELGYVSKINSRVVWISLVIYIELVYFRLYLANLGKVKVT